MREHQKPQNKVKGRRPKSDTGSDKVSTIQTREDLRDVFRELTGFARDVVKNCAEQYRMTGTITDANFDLLGLFVGYAINARKLVLDNKKIRLGHDVVESCRTKTGLSPGELLKAVADAGKTN